MRRTPAATSASAIASKAAVGRPGEKRAERFGIAAAHQEHVAQDAAEAVQAAGRLERGAQARVGPEGVERRRRGDELQRRRRAEGLAGLSA